MLQPDTRYRREDTLSRTQLTGGQLLSPVICYRREVAPAGHRVQEGGCSSRAQSTGGRLFRPGTTYKRLIALSCHMLQERGCSVQTHFIGDWTLRPGTTYKRAVALSCHIFRGGRGVRILVMLPWGGLSHGLSYAAGLRKPFQVINMLPPLAGIHWRGSAGRRRIGSIGK